MTKSTIVVRMQNYVMDDYVMAWQVGLQTIDDDNEFSVEEVKQLSDVDADYRSTYEESLKLPQQLCISISIIM